MRWKAFISFQFYPDFKKSLCVVFGSVPFLRRGTHTKEEIIIIIKKMIIIIIIHHRKRTEKKIEIRAPGVQLSQTRIDQ